MNSKLAFSTGLSIGLVGGTVLGIAYVYQSVKNSGYELIPVDRHSAIEIQNE